VPAAAQAAPILIVEDDAVSRRLLVRQLATLGFVDLDTARNGREGLEKCLARPYALVLSDVSMPDMDGYELICALRSEGLAVPVVIVTAGEPRDAAATDDRQTWEIAGFLGKPVLLEHLQALLETLLSEFPAPSAPSDSPRTAAPEPLTDAAPRAAMPPDAELYALFLDTVETDLEVLRRALRQEDREAFLRGTHKLKGALAILGETALVQACGGLSKLAAQRSLAQAQEALERFERALKEATARIKIL
jgi:two-component system capsular synthesis sensor histidine kinase RcsC